MTEKQASSEIAQSRERFEKWADDYFDNVFPVTWDSDEEAYTQAEVQNSWLSWQAAERDTRERLSHEARRWLLRFVLRYENNNLVGYEIADALAEALRTDKWPESVWKNPFDLAERIRGKE